MEVASFVSGYPEQIETLFEQILLVCDEQGLSSFFKLIRFEKMAGYLRLLYAPSCNRWSNYCHSFKRMVKNR